MVKDQIIGVSQQVSALLVRGKDSTRFLNGMLSQDVQIPGSAGLAFLLTNKGKIISPLYFVSLPDETYCLWTSEGSFEVLFSGLNKYLIADQVELEPLRSLKAWTLVHSEYPVSPLANRGRFGLERLFAAHIQSDAYIVPQGILSRTHVEILCLPTFNKSYSEISAENLWSLYFKEQRPQWGVDLYTDDFFLEFPLADSVSFDKGCYVGQETVARGTFRGKVNKSYAHFISDKPLIPGEVLGENGEKLGVLRSVQDNQGTGLAKLDLGDRKSFFMNGEKISLEIKHLVNEETFRKGR